MAGKSKKQTKGVRKANKSKAKASKTIKKSAKSKAGSKKGKSTKKVTKTKKTVKAIKKSSLKVIDFKFYAPLSKKVKLGGDFNKWKPASLKNSKKGIWSTNLKLKPGRYEYKFQIDGNWENDNQRQTELVSNGLGEANNVIVVE